MKIEKIRPIPKYMVEKIRKYDKRRCKEQDGHTRFYSYLTTNDGELVKVTVAVRNKYKKWYCKQCAVHGIHSKECFVKDMVFCYMSGYSVGWHAEGLTTSPKWYEDNEWGEAHDDYFNPFAPIINKEYAFKFPEYKYSAVDLYKGDCVLKYLRLYEKYPQIEYLVKLGIYSHYATSNQILNLVGKDKRFQKWIAKNRLELSEKEYHIESVLQAYKTNQPLKKVQAHKQLRKEGRFEPIREMLGGEYEEYLNYIVKQNTSNDVYLDYLNACNYLGLDMSLDKNRFPHDFMRWHDIRIDEYSTAKALKDEEERKELFFKFATVSEKYLPLQDEKKGEFISVIAKSPADLIREGDLLHHCVGSMNYDQKFVREETLIFFIRSREAPDTPFVTVEYSPERKKVLQCYAYHDTTPDKAVTHYVNDIWLPYANRTLKRIAV